MANMIVQGLLSLLGYFLEKRGLSIKADKAFFDFVDALKTEGVVPAKTLASYQNQRDKNRAEIEGKK